jgi:hypothetical protein
MKSHALKCTAIFACCLLSLACANLHAEDTVVFEDTMNTLNNWTKGALVTSDDTVDHAPYMKMNNGITVAKLPREINSDWTLSADVKHTMYSRGLWLGLFDTSMKHGYAMLWDSSLEKMFHGKGMFVICSVEEAEKAVDFHTKTKRLGKTIEGPQPITDPKFAHIKLTFESATGKLTLFVNDKSIQTVTDTSFKSFDRIVLRGNTYSLMDNVKVTVPETAQ